MISDFIAALVSVFVLGPIQDEVQTRLDNARPAAAVVEQVRVCVATAGPALVERATNDPWWAVGQAVGITTGWSEPLALLSEAHPQCRPALRLLTQERNGEEGEV